MAEVPGWKECPRCQGTAYIYVRTDLGEDEEECPMCNNTGKVFHIPKGRPIVHSPIHERTLEMRLFIPFVGDDDQIEKAAKRILKEIRTVVHDSAHGQYVSMEHDWQDIKLDKDDLV